MANQEDYLDDLLASVNQVKSDVNRSHNEKETARKEKVMRRSKISPEDDFLSASGIDSENFDFMSQQNHSRPNLRKAFSENDFIRSFEDELSDGDVDSFLSSFEQEAFGQPKDDEDDLFSAGAAEENVAPNLIDSVNQVPEEAPSASLLDNIENVVSAAKEHILSDSASLEAQEDEQTEILTEDAPMETEEEEPFTLDSISEALPEENPAEEVSEQAPEETIPVMESARSDNEDGAIEMTQEELDRLLNGQGEISGDGSFVPPGYGADELDREDADSPYLGEDMDLDALLGEDSEFSDLGSLLDAVSNGEELDEARAEYEKKAADASGEGKNQGKKGSLSDKIKAVFTKLFHQEDTDDDFVEIDQPGFEFHNAENQEIIRNFEEAEREAEAKAKSKEEKAAKKAEKKAEKEAAKAAKAEAKKNKPPKEKKEKKPGGLKLWIANSPKIPVGTIGVFILLGLSLAAMILVGANIISSQNMKKQANAYYNSGKYVEAYETVAGSDLETKDPTTYGRIHMMADLAESMQQYQTFLAMGKYDYALDALVCGYAHYADHVSMAEEYGITDEYNDLGQQLSQALLSQFNVSTEEAMDMYQSNYREEYSEKLYAKLAALGLED